MTSQDAQEQGNTGNKGEPATPTLSVDITMKCVDITERFCAGTISKVSAILELQKTIP